MLAGACVIKFVLNRGELLNFDRCGSSSSHSSSGYGETSGASVLSSLLSWVMGAGEFPVCWSSCALSTLGANTLLGIDSLSFFVRRCLIFQKYVERLVGDLCCFCGLLFISLSFSLGFLLLQKSWNGLLARVRC